MTEPTPRTDICPRCEGHIGNYLTSSCLMCHRMTINSLERQCARQSAQVEAMREAIKLSLSLPSGPASRAVLEQSLNPKNEEGTMARCLRCKAGNEWIEGDVKPALRAAPSLTKNWPEDMPDWFIDLMRNKWDDSRAIWAAIIAKLREQEREG